MIALGGRRNSQEDRRQAPREEVYHRTRAVSMSGTAVPLHIVNISATGFMARTEAALAPGETLSLRLPIVGERQAELRWALGGRIGCQFRQPIALAEYLQLLGALAERRS